MNFLDCPDCGEPCETIPPCNGGHPECQAEVPRSCLHRFWCDDRAGVCQCGARLYVEVDDDRAYLVALDEDEDEDEDA